MKFALLKVAGDHLRQAIRDATQRDLISLVSVEEPTSDDELGFYKLVLWSYAFWVEACSPAGRHILGSLRNTSPDKHKAAAETFKILGFLRTRLAHNLGQSPGDRYQVDQSNIWLDVNGGVPISWADCFDALTQKLCEALNSLADQWELMLKSSEDAAVAVEHLIKTVDQDWPGYLFDPIIVSTAESLELDGLDIVEYRQSRHEDWRKLTKMFNSRGEAEVAIRRIIRMEMTVTFGDPAQKNQ
jgi:hypothetical protein